MNELLEIFGSELLIELLEAGIQHIPRLSTRGPNCLLWFEFRRVIQTRGDNKDDVWKTRLQQYVRTTLRAETSLELSAAVGFNGIISRFIGGEVKLVTRHPKERDKSTAARPLASPAMALVLKHGF